MRHPLPTTIDMPTEAPVLTLSNGTTVDLGDKIGAGGMAEIYACMVGGKHAVAKVLKENASIRLQERFRTEGERLGTLNILQIPRLLDTGTVHEFPCIVMERVDGACLQEVTREMPDRRIPGDILRHIAYGCASVLGEMHARAIVHRDIKPNNFMLGRQRGRPTAFGPWLVDLGLSAKTSDADGDEEGTICGTPNYMDPQVWQKSAVHEPASDVFGLGMTLHEELRGRLPWTEDQRKLVCSDPEQMTALFDISLRPQTRAERPWMEMIGAMLRYDLDRRPTCPEVCERLKAMGADTRGGIDLNIHYAFDPKMLAQAILRSHKTTRQRLQWLFGSAAAVSILVGVLAAPWMGTPSPQPLPNEPAAPMKNPDKAPQLSPALQAALTKAKSAPHAFMRNAEQSHVAHAFSLTTEELCILLEEGAPGTSAGLPKRAQYPAYLYRMRPDSAEEEVLLQLTRGCFHVRGQNATFHRTAQPGDDVRSFLEPWKRLDMAADTKELQRINDALRELRKAAKVK